MRESPKKGEEKHHKNNQSSSYDEPWKDPKLLEQLYWDQELSLREVGSKLGCNRSTVQMWLQRYGIERRLPNDEKRDPCLSTNNGGYTYVTSAVGSDEDRVAIHQLAAISSGENPHEVFDENTHVHHHLGVPRDFDVTQIDIPGNVTVMDSSKHQRKHQKGTHSNPGLDEIFNRS